MRAGRLRCVGLDATPAGHGIYAQRGFADAASPGLVRMRLEPTATADPPPGVVRLDASDLEGVLARDREVFGADRSPVLRWAFGAAPDLACVVRDAGRVRGYCFGRHGDHSDQVGPVVADDAALARDLVLACLSRSRSRPLVLDARVEPAWLVTLGDLGFREQRPFTRMYRGDARPEARPVLEPVVFGPEFG